MALLRPADIFLIQSAIEQYVKKHPGCEAPSAEVALTWMMERRKGSKPEATAKVSEPGLLAKMFANLRFLLKPASSLSR